jgi:hypothetical protein
MWLERVVELLHQMGARAVKPPGVPASALTGAGGFFSGLPGPMIVCVVVDLACGSGHERKTSSRVPEEICPLQAFYLHGPSEFCPHQ